MIDVIDTVVTESTVQHQNDILEAHKGWFKFSPQMGVGLLNYVNGSTSFEDLRFEIRRNFNADGLKIKSLELSGSEINIDANY